MKWLSPDHQPFELCGFPFFSRDHMYRRVQVNPPEPLPKEVDFLANQTAGGRSASGLSWKPSTSVSG